MSLRGQNQPDPFKEAIDRLESEADREEFTRGIVRRSSTMIAELAARAATFREQNVLLRDQNTKLCAATEAAIVQLDAAADTMRHALLALEEGDTAGAAAVLHSYVDRVPELPPGEDSAAPGRAN